MLILGQFNAILCLKYCCLYFDLYSLCPYSARPMKPQPLPRSLDARKFARSAVQLYSVEPVKSFPRFVALLADSEGEVAVHLDFYRDEARAYRIDVELKAEVNMICQRCLKAMPSKIETSSRLGLVWSDDTAKALPKDIDPLILGEEPLDVLEMLADELIVGTPYVAYHEEADCSAPVNPEFSASEAEIASSNAVKAADSEVEAEEGRKENPFAVLASLKKD